MASGNATTFRAIDVLVWSASCRFGLLLTNGGVGVPSAPSLSCVVVREVCRMAHPRADSAANGPKRQRPGASQQAPGISTATRVPGARHDRICVAGEHSSPAPPCAAAAALTVDLESASGARHGRARRRRPGGVAVGWVSRGRGGSAVSRAWRTPADPGLVVWTGEPGSRLVWTSAADWTRAQSPPERIYGVSICRLLHVFVGWPGRSSSSDFGADGFSLLAAYGAVEPLRVPEPAGVRRPSPVRDGRRRARTLNSDGSVADRCDSVGGVAGGPRRGPGTRVGAARLPLRGGRPAAGVWL